MIERFPDRGRDPSWQAEKEVQPDPMLQERHNAGPVAIGLAALFALLIVAVLFYGLNNGREETIATQGTEPSISTSGDASTSGSAPPTQAQGPAGQNTTGAQQSAQNKGGAPSGGQAQPANQGQEGGKSNRAGAPSAGQ